MKIYNIGSVNCDHVYRVDRLPQPGETLQAHRYQLNLGGKGLNISVAAMRAGAQIRHIGAIGAGDDKVQSLMREQGIDCTAIAQVDTITGHAIVYVDDKSENEIVIFGGANHALTETHIRSNLADASEGDWLVLQNETNANEIGLKVAREKGMKVALVAAPFDIKTMPDLIRRVDLASMNTTETEEFEKAIGTSYRNVTGPSFLITYGTKGAEFFNQDLEIRMDAFEVTAIDTTGAGDTFFGSFLAKYAAGQTVKQALSYASASAALQVQRQGASIAIPAEDDVLAFLHLHSQTEQPTIPANADPGQ